MDTFFEKKLSGEGLLLLDFFATWCGPCMAMNPVLEELSAEMADSVEILKVDVDKYTDLAVRMKVMGVPTFVLFSRGQELWRMPGPLSKVELQHAIEAAL